MDDSEKHTAVPKTSDEPEIESETARETVEDVIYGILHFAAYSTAHSLFTQCPQMLAHAILC